MRAVYDYLETHRNRFLSELQEWLVIPSISALPEYADDVHRAGCWAKQHLEKIGFPVVELVEGEVEGDGHPLVYAEWLGKEGAPTVLMYGHYDVQPVDPLNEWDSEPFAPEIRDGIIYGRGTADDKGQVMLLFAALEAWVAVNGALPVNVKILLEGEEESGGDMIGNFLNRQKERLACDCVLIADTHMNGLEEPSLISSLRGMLYAEITVRGAQSDLHSGTFGGVAPNPLHALTLLLSRIKGEDGRINVDHLYDNEIQVPDLERRFWEDDTKRMTDDLLQAMGVSALVGENEFTPHARLGIRPTFEIHGIRGGFIGEGAKTVIPAEAMAKVSLRLPAGLEPNAVFAELEKAVQRFSPAGYKVTVVNMHGGEGLAVSADDPFIGYAVSAVEEVYQKTPVFMREGGSIPIVSSFDKILGASVVLLGFGLPDDGIHGPNEHFNLQQFSRGMRTLASFLGRVAGIRGE